MKTISDKTTRDELIERVRRLKENASAQWGKMNVHQMVRHCCLSEEMLLGKKKYKQNLVGFLFGKIALRGIMKDEKPMMRNSPTVPNLKVKENVDFEKEKKRWIHFLEEHADVARLGIMHPFFGKMTKEQIDRLVYKHTDHHLRQFGA
jgi:hypothetical protein